MKSIVSWNSGPSADSVRVWPLAKVTVAEAESTFFPLAGLLPGENPHPARPSRPLRPSELAPLIEGAGREPADAGRILNEV